MIDRAADTAFARHDEADSLDRIVITENDLLEALEHTIESGQHTASEMARPFDDTLPDTLPTD
ncbi:MAG: hypothetical protein WAK84_05410 [Candidatus Cybelea sp.]